MSGDLAGDVDLAAATPVDLGSPIDASLVNARPYNMHVPPSYDPAKPMPLVVALHGYSTDSGYIDGYFGLADLADTRGFLYAWPQGTLDSEAHYFWNATDACCDFHQVGTDDVAYLGAVLDDIERRYAVDPKRVFFVGHSNGGFMSYRVACELSGRVAGIVSLSGAMWADAKRCTPSAPVSVLEVHGDTDSLISYAGGMNLHNGVAFGSYPSAHTSVGDWAANNRCTGAMQTSAVALDIDSSIAGAETRVDSYSGCVGSAVELWTIQGGGHIPLLQSTWPSLIYDFLSAHPRL